MPVVEVDPVPVEAVVTSAHNRRENLRDVSTRITSGAITSLTQGYPTGLPF
jgi:hypothetical protein